MNTTEDFENAPFAATATRDDGLMAVKIDDGERSWVTPLEKYLDDEEMMILGYTLDRPAPTTAREALGLAWDLAYPIREGQIIPAGTDYLVSRNGERPATMRANLDQFASKSDETNRRTLEPLPEPLPDWLDAPAVIATTRRCAQEIWLPETGGHYWECTHCDDVRYWRDLTDVTPLHPKEV